MVCEECHIPPLCAILEYVTNCCSTANPLACCYLQHYAYTHTPLAAQHLQFGNCWCVCLMDHALERPHHVIHKSYLLAVTHCPNAEAGSYCQIAVTTLTHISHKLRCTSSDAERTSHIHIPTQQVHV